MKKQVYFDNAATTRIDDEVLAEMKSYFTEKYANASSQHFMGQEAKQAMEHSRKIIAKEIGAKSHEIIFTSGGTESNNFAIKGLFFWHRDNKPEKNHIVTTKIEHDCVLNACKWLETHGAEVTYLDVDKEGFINPEQLRDAITDKTFLVSVIHGNNEIGTLQDLEAIGKICREKEVLFHSDACQSFTKVDIDVQKQNLSLLTLNAHKIHGPKGVGALYLKRDVGITPLAHGGGHEKGLRSGTENVSGIVGFGKAIAVAKRKDVQRIEQMRNRIIDGILEIPNTCLNGSREKRLCNNINISFNDIEGEAIGGYLENEGICTSTGSACSSHTLETSHVLQALGLSAIQANSSIRISISKYTTEEEIDYLLINIKKVVDKLRRISPFAQR